MAEVLVAENLFSNIPSATERAVAHLVTALSYKSEGRGFDS